MLSSDNAASSREVIALLRTDGPRVKGLRIGRWRVEEQKVDNGAGEGTEAVVVLTGLMDAAFLGHGNAPHADAKYTFAMRLGLRTKPLGRCVLFLSTCLDYEPTPCPISISIAYVLLVDPIPIVADLVFMMHTDGINSTFSDTNRFE
jgi:hypothetical protein